jgi:ribosomal protein S27AE
MSNIPNEYRVDCGECGFDGGTYDYRSNPDAPKFCPSCGTSSEVSESLHIVISENEPTSISEVDDE